MADGDLTTLDAVKSWLSIGGASGDDALLTSLITQVSAYVPNVIQRGVLTKQYVESRTGNGKTRMQLRNWPIQSVQSVAWRGYAITNSVDAFANESGISTDGQSLLLIGYALPYGEPIRITYTAGWDVVPADIASAVIELVGEAYTRRTHIGETSHSTNGATTVAFSREEMHQAIAGKLSNYIRVAPLC